MKKQLLLPFFALVALSLLLSNCASLTGLQDGRTVGKGNGEMSVSINASQTPDFNKWKDQIDTITKIPRYFFPNFEFGGRYGVADNIDITLRLNTNLNVGLGAKFQVIGDRESAVALSLGAEVGSFGLVTGLWNVQVPVFFSVHPTPKFAWYLTPRYIRQFEVYSGVSGGLNYVGANTGLLFGEKNKFGLDLGYYNLSSGGISTGMLQIGIGGRFAFGGN
jgi:hypothetical protein